jgi:glyoxylase-like metal-dependent hydrolase (beta-lactamase superfamily II)
MPNTPTIQAFFDEATNTVSYLVADPQTKRAAVVDPVLDYDHASGKAATRSRRAEDLPARV